MSTVCGFGSMPSCGQVHTKVQASSSSKHADALYQRCPSTSPRSGGEVQLLKQLYMTLLRGLRQQYLEDLLEMQALCTLLCGMRSPAQAKMKRLQQLNERHLRPVIEQLQEPKAALLRRQIRRRDIDRLIRLKDLMGPFIQDFSQTAHALRRQAFQTRPVYNCGKNAAAAAA